MKKKKSPSSYYRKQKRHTYILTKRLHEFLKTHPLSVKFKKIKGKCVGYYDDDDEIITLDYRRDIIPTLIHEFIHHIHPKWKEEAVEKEEERIMNYITAIQCRNIIRALPSAL